MWLIFSFKCTLVIYALYSAPINVDGKSWKKSSNSKKYEIAEQSPNVSTENDNSLEYGKSKLAETYYNPVIQNVTSFFGYLKAERRKKRSNKSKHSRRKRQSQQRNCAGQCEDSLCSWHEEYDEESTRIPRFIKYAVCDSPTCNFGFAGLNHRTAYALQLRTQCDLVKTDILVTNTDDGQQRWLTNWPIACVCTQRHAVPSSTRTVMLRHEGMLMENVFTNAVLKAGMTTVSLDDAYDSNVLIPRDDVDVDITRNEQIEPVPRQHIILDDVRRRPLTHAQRRRLRNQQRHMQHVETWEHLMLRKYNRT